MPHGNTSRESRKRKDEFNAESIVLSLTLLPVLLCLDWVLNKQTSVLQIQIWGKETDPSTSKKSS